MNMVKMGESELTMEQSIGVISGIAIRKVICVMKNPSTDAMSILNRSFYSTCSLGVKRDMDQKSRAAPSERMKNSVIGVKMLLLVRSLHTMMLIPNMAYAMKQAMCPIAFPCVRSMSWSAIDFASGVF